MVDPLPQSLVLTAIVIGFGVTAVALTLLMRLYERKGTVMVSDLRGLKW
jgi:multisubunit Na+/H+ antiporter MnhC subunit